MQSSFGAPTILAVKGLVKDEDDLICPLRLGRQWIEQL